jgi:hypothetical protein
MPSQPTAVSATKIQLHHNPIFCEPSFSLSAMATSLNYPSGQVKAGHSDGLTKWQWRSAVEAMAFPRTAREVEAVIHHGATPRAHTAAEWPRSLATGSAEQGFAGPFPRDAPIR